MTEKKEFPEEEVGLRDYLAVILRRKWIVIAIFAVIVVVATINSFKTEPMYKATCQILIERENPKVVNIQEIMAVDASTTDYYQTQYEILKNKKLAEKVIEHLNLVNNKEFNPESKTDFAIIVGKYLSRLEIEPIRKSRLVNISFEDHDPRLAALIANNHAKLYIEQILERRFSTSQEAGVWLNKRIKEEKKRLEDSEKALYNYKQKNNLVSIGFEEKNNIIIQKLDELNSVLIQAKTLCIEKESLHSEIERLLKKSNTIESVPAVVSNPLIQQLKADYIKSKAEYSQLSRKYGPEHPQIIRLKSQIKETKSKIAKEVKNILDSIEIEYRVARKQEKSLIKALEEQKKEALKLNKKEIQYNVLKRDAESNCIIYNNLLKRVKESAVTENLGLSNVSIIDPATVPNSPFKPKKRRDILLAIMIGLFGGGGFAFFLEYLDNTIDTPEKIQRYLKIPFMGPLGRVALSKFVYRYGTELVALKEANSQTSEMLRSIRTNILFSASDKPKKAFLITSALPLEGKSFVISNLAVSLAQMKKKVLLVDCDLRKPRLHQIFNLEKLAGLTDILSGKNSPESVFQDTEIEDLKLISCGTKPPNPAELLSSESMTELISNLRKEFDFILFDSPPIMSVTDAVVLATLVDGVVIVIKSGETPRFPIQQAIEQLSEVDARIVGAILNNMDFENRSYYYHYYKHYYNYGNYGREEQESNHRKQKS
jgi:capsular exopolysaccharide synthesis family protein